MLQGSILGPVLFICNTSDLIYHVVSSNPLLYSYDTAIIYRSKNVGQIQADMSADFLHLDEWFSVNKLKVNADKTKVMLFTHPRGTLKNAEINVTLDSTELESVKTFKYLGITLDEYLNSNKHVEMIKHKLDQRTRLLRSFISQDLALHLLKSLIAPQFNYCCHIYDGCTLTTQCSLQTCQNNALQAVLRDNSRYLTASP